MFTAVLLTEHYQPCASLMLHPMSASGSVIGYICCLLSWVLNHDLRIGIKIPSWQVYSQPTPFNITVPCLSCMLLHIVSKLSQYDSTNAAVQASYYFSTRTLLLGQHSQMCMSGHLLITSQEGTCFKHKVFAAGLEVIPDLEVPCPSDGPAVPDVLPPSPQPPGLSPQTSPEGTTRLLCIGYAPS